MPKRPAARPAGDNCGLVTACSFRSRELIVEARFTPNLAGIEPGLPAIFRLDTRTASAPPVFAAVALVAVGLITGCGGTGEPLWGEGATDQSDGAQSAESSGDSAGTDESGEAGEADDGAMAGRNGSGRDLSDSDTSESDMAGNDMSDSDMAGAGEQAMAAEMAPPAEDNQSGGDAGGASSTSPGARAMEGLFARERGRPGNAAASDRVAALRAEVSELREQVESLRPAVERFRTIEEDIRALLDRVAAMADNADMADSSTPSESETASTAQRDRNPTQPPQDPALSQGGEESGAMPEEALAPTEGDAVGVHLVSYNDRAVAEEGWPKLRREFSDLLDGMQARLATVTLSDGSTFHRLIAGPVESRSAARDLCQRLEEQGQYCSPAAFIGGPA